MNKVWEPTCISIIYDYVFFKFKTCGFCASIYFDHVKFKQCYNEVEKWLICQIWLVQMVNG